MVMMHQCRFTSFNKCNTLVISVENEGHYVYMYMWGKVRYEKSLYFPLKFYCEPKTA